ncbi:MAG: glycine zipper domain-containing protein [Planctomycetota bacterium]
MDIKRLGMAGLLGVAALGVGCESYTARGAGIGAGFGAIGGAIIGNQSGDAGEGAALGALVGGLAGGAIGAYQDDRERQYREAEAYEYGYYEGSRQRGGNIHYQAPRRHHYSGGGYYYEQSYGYDPYCR